MKNASFIPANYFDKGRYPSIAVNSAGTVISGHQRQGDSSLYYNVGTSNSNDSITFPSGGTNFDDGAPPRFAINDNNLAVEIHKSNGTSTNIWYHVGNVNPSAKSWDHGDSSKTGSSGQDPDVAINNGNSVVMVFEDDGKIKYRVGTIDVSKRKFNLGSEEELASGERPTVAITDSGLVVIAYENNGVSWWLGQISGSKINGYGGGSISGPQNPSVGITDDGFVMLAYSRDSDAFGRAGQVTNNQIIFGAEMQYAYTSNPWVDCKGQYAVQAYPSDDFADYSLYASVSPIYDRATWMASNPNIQNLSLKQLVFPGSHDAGMSVSIDCTAFGTLCNTRTQFISIGNQLEMGCRYFDVRPVYYNQSFDTGHYSDVSVVGIQGCNGQSLDSVLSEAASFVANGKETVVLKFSHYYDKDSDKMGFSDQIMTQLVNLVKQKLGTHLYINNTTSRLADIPISTITANGSRVIAVFEDAGSHSDPSAGIYSYADYKPGGALNADLVVYDQYSNTNDLNTMINDQWNKQGNTANHGGDLFLLSWTLTQSGTQATACGVSWLDSIIAISGAAASSLYPQSISRFNSGHISMSTIPNVLYVDICNGYATDVARYLNTQLGEKINAAAKETTGALEAEVA